MTDHVADTLTTRLADALALIELAVDQAGDRVLDGPDNPAIQRAAGGRTIAFTIKMSDIATAGRKSSGNWDPFFHDWVAQYRYARDLLVARRFHALRELLAGGGYRDPSHGMRIFATEVIEHIRAITGDLQAAVALTDARRMTTAPVATGSAPDPDGVSHSQLPDGLVRDTYEPRQLRRKP